MVLIAGFLLSVIVAWYILSPMLCTSTNAEDGSGGQRREALAVRQNLVDQKSRALQVLKDLELDYAMGNISADDYERTKNQLSLEVGGIITQMEK